MYNCSRDWRVDFVKVALIVKGTPRCTSDLGTGVSLQSFKVVLIVKETLLCTTDLGTGVLV